MVSPVMKPAALDKDHLAKVQALEKELGTVLVALEPQIQVATLRPEQLRQVQALEEQMGVILVAFQKS